MYSSCETVPSPSTSICVHHFLGAQTTGVTAGGEAGEVSPPSELMNVFASSVRLLFVEHREDLLDSEPFVLRDHAVAVGIDLVHHVMGAQPLA